MVSDSPDWVVDDRLRRAGVKFQDLPSMIAKACHTIWAQQPGGCSSDRDDSQSTTCLAKIRGRPGPEWGKLSTKGVGLWEWLRSNKKRWHDSVVVAAGVERTVAAAGR